MSSFSSSNLKCTSNSPQNDAEISQKSDHTYTMQTTSE